MKEVKVPHPNSRPDHNQPSASADRFATEILEELRRAGFVVVDNSGKGEASARVFAAITAVDFMIRLRAIDRHQLLRSDLQGMLGKYVEFAFHRQSVAQAMNTVLRTAGSNDYESSDRIVAVYVVNHRWPDWVTRFLKSPAADEIVKVLREANGPVRRIDLEKKLPGIPADTLQSTLVTLIAHLVVFEDLDPQTCDLLVGLLPAVHASRAASLQHTERPPLVAGEKLTSILPEGSILVDDLRAFLLEVVAEPPRLRQDDEIFQKDLDRFLWAPPEVPAALVQALNLTRETRLKQAKEWAHHLRLVGKRAQAKQSRLEVSSRGNKWLTSSLPEQYHLVYEFLQTRRSDKAASISGSTSGSDHHATYGVHECAIQFLGVNAVAIRTRSGFAEHYWTAKAEDHKALQDSLDRSLSVLPVGVFFRLESVLDHLAFEQHNPLSLGLPLESVAVFTSGRAVPPLEELRDQAARELLTNFLRKRLIPLGCFQVGIDPQGHLCVARHRLFDLYFGRKVKDEVMAGSSARKLPWWFSPISASSSSA